MTAIQPGLIEFVHILPNEGMRDAMLALRPRFCADFRQKTAGFISDSFHEMEDNSFLDIVYWTGADVLEAVDENHPMLDAWYCMVWSRL